ncbi:MAG TPA: TetR/AcrR family transcriptional regulator [Acidimicrobiales bacterium]
MSTERPAPSRRRSPQDFFDGAIEVLESDGFIALTAAGLCDRMGITRGSFYHHFASFDDFVDRLLGYWEERYTTTPVADVEATEGDDAKREQQLRFAQLLPHGAEAAIRAWSAVNPRVAAAQRQVDTSRRESTADQMRRHGLSDADATVFADLAVASLIGMEQLDRPADVDKLLQVLALVQTLIEERHLRV